MRPSRHSVLRLAPSSFVLWPCSCPLDAIHRFGAALNIVEIHLEPESHTGRHLGRAVGSDSDLGTDQIAREIPGARGNVAGQREAWQTGQSEIVRPSDSRFQHAPAPNWNAPLVTELVNR